MKKTTAKLLACLFLLAAPSANADIEADLDNLFDDMQAFSNITPPGFSSGATRGIAGYGSFFYRAPTRRLQPIGVTLPSFSTRGCGGIDLFTGGFSFVSKEQIVAYMRQLASNAVGVAFSMGLKALSAPLDATIQEFRAAIDAINSFQLDSCEDAKMLVSGISGKAQTHSSNLCSIYGGDTADDSFAARFGCASDDSTRGDADRLAKMEQGANPNQVRGCGFGKDINLTWDVIKRSPALDRERRELIMSLFGAQIIRSTESTVNFDSQFLAPTLEVADLASDETLSVYRCDDTDDCLNPTPTDTTLPSTFIESIEDDLIDIATELNTTGDLTAEQNGLLVLAPVAQFIEAERSGASGALRLASTFIANQIIFQETKRIAAELRQSLSNAIASCDQADRFYERMYAEARDVVNDAKDDLDVSAEKLNNILSVNLRALAIADAAFQAVVAAPPPAGR